MAKTLLNELRDRTRVDLDSLDYTVAQILGPFVDCTSNQAIAWFELSKPQNHSVLASATEKAVELAKQTPFGLRPEELAVEVAMVELGLRIVPYLTGNVHIQINPYNSYDEAQIVANAKRIIELFSHLQPGFDVSRVCIKVPGTWEGLHACKTLELGGTKTLATTLFSLEQAALAGLSGCTYIAPYVNELRVHFEKGYKDPSSNNELVVMAQEMYRANGFKTQVLPASLTSVEDCMGLAGVHHMTISPTLLEQLSKCTREDIDIPSSFDQKVEPAVVEKAILSSVTTESQFRMAFTRNSAGVQEYKQIYAINAFCNMQDQLETLMKGQILLQRGGGAK